MFAFPGKVAAEASKTRLKLVKSQAYMSALSNGPVTPGTAKSVAVEKYSWATNGGGGGGGGASAQLPDTPGCSSAPMSKADPLGRPSPSKSQAGALTLPTPAWPPLHT